VLRRLGLSGHALWEGAKRARCHYRPQQESCNTERDKSIAPHLEFGSSNGQPISSEVEGCKFGSATRRLTGSKQAVAVRSCSEARSLRRAQRETWYGGCGQQQCREKRSQLAVWNHITTPFTTRRHAVESLVAGWSSGRLDDNAGKLMKPLMLVHVDSSQWMVFVHEHGLASETYRP
jgi:hypothetical protein